MSMSIADDVRGRNPYHHPHPSYMADLLRKHHRGQDITEDESADVKRWFDCHGIWSGLGITGKLVAAFPHEREEWIDENNHGARAWHKPTQVQEVNSHFMRLDRINIQRIRGWKGCQWQVWVPFSGNTPQGPEADNFFVSFEAACDFVARVLRGGDITSLTEQQSDGSYGGGGQR